MNTITNTSTNEQTLVNGTNRKNTISDLPMIPPQSDAQYSYECAGIKVRVTYANQGSLTDIMMGMFARG